MQVGRLQQSLNLLTVVSLAGPGQLRESHRERFLEFHSGRFPILKLFVHPLDKQANNPSDVRIVSRVVTALKSIDTAYTAVVGDDDFLLPEFAVKAVTELEKNSRLVAVSGIVLNLHEDTRKLRVRNLSNSVRSEALSAVGTRDYASRLEQESANFDAQFLGSVIRTKAQIAMWSGLEDLPIRWTDNLAVLEALRFGDVRRLPVVSQIRGVNQRMVDVDLDKGPQDDLTKEQLTGELGALAVNRLLKARGYSKEEAELAQRFVRISVSGKRKVLKMTPAQRARQVWAYLVHVWFAVACRLPSSRTPMHLFPAR